MKPGIARNAAGEPLASLEVVTVINLERPDNPLLASSESEPLRSTSTFSGSPEA